MTQPLNEPTTPQYKRKTVPLTIWTKDGKFVEPHTEGAVRNVIGSADISESGLAYLTVNETTYDDNFRDALIRDDMMSFSIDDTHPDFPDEMPVRFTPKQAFALKKFVKQDLPEGPPQLIQEYLRRVNEAQIRAWSNPPAPVRHPAALVGCTCPWNNGFPVKGHHIACPYLKGHHDPEDDCGPAGHNNKE